MAAPFRRLPREAVGSNLVHPLVAVVFVAVVVAIGIPTAEQRSGAELLSHAAIAATVAVISVPLWRLYRRREATSRRDVLVGLVLAVLILAEVWLTVLVVGDGLPVLQTAPYLVLVHLMVWALSAIVVTRQLRYRRALRTLREVSSRVTYASTQALDDLVSRASELAAEARVSISSRLAEVERGLREPQHHDTAALLETLRELREKVIAPTIAEMNGLLERLRNQPVTPVRKARVDGVPLRWNRRFFSGSVGGLLIGIVAIVAAAPQAAERPGFLLQIPIIVLAFMVSVPASLLLFFGAALTPFLQESGPTSTADSLVFLVLIVGVAVVSFLVRWAEVQQLRALEATNVASATVAIAFALVAQDFEQARRRWTSVLHGPIQGSLVAASLVLEQGPPSQSADLARIQSTLAEALEALEGEVADSPDFARALTDVVGLWSGSVTLEIVISPRAQDLLEADTVAAATVIQVVSEGILNGIKHAGAEEVMTSITAEGSMVRVTVSHANNGTDFPVRRVDALTIGGFGLGYLRQLTASLTLVREPEATVLIAEIPTRV